MLIPKRMIHIRLFVKRGMSIKYLLPNPVIDYIYKRELYKMTPPDTTTTTTH